MDKYLPNRNDCVIPDEKIHIYLLNLNHQKGKSKAKFFNNFGFNIENANKFIIALKNHAINRPVVAKKENNFGIKYTLRCLLETPDGRNPCIDTIWIIELLTNQPRLITAYPAKQNEN